LLAVADTISPKQTLIFKLLSRKDQSLLVRRNSFLVLNLGLDIVDRVRGFDLEGDGLASSCGFVRLSATRKRYRSRHSGEAEALLIRFSTLLAEPDKAASEIHDGADDEINVIVDMDEMSASSCGGRKLKLC
jgi:hypothetical protein